MYNFTSLSIFKSLGYTVMLNANYKNYVLLKAILFLLTYSEKSWKIKISMPIQ